MNTCYIDIGNTCIKYSLLDQTSVSTVDSLRALYEIFEGAQVAQVFVSCVAGQATELAKYCNKQDIRFYCASVEDKVSGLKLIYNDVSKLGVDRWLAMQAALNEFSGAGVVVIDAGTALKIDVVSAQAKHLGGSISPGIKMALSALQRNTAQLPQVHAEFDGQLGTDTIGCMRYGVVMSAVALIDRSVAALEGDYSVILTGGDAALLAPHLAGAVSIVDNLVIGGLKRLHKDGYFSDKEST